MTDPDSVAMLMENLKYQQEVVELERKVSLYFINVDEWLFMMISVKYIFLWH